MSHNFDYFYPLSTHQVLTDTKLKNHANYQIDLKNFYAKIDQNPDLVGSGVIYINERYESVQLRPANNLCRQNNINIIIRETPPITKPNLIKQETQSPQRQSELMGELVSTGLSCGSAVLAWVVVASSGALIPFTGGSSSVVTVISYGAAVASTGQCILGVSRTGGEIFDPNLKDEVTNNAIFQALETTLDVASLAGVAVSGATALKAFSTLKAASGKSTREILKSMSRSERKRLTNEVIRNNHPGISNKVLKSLVRKGQYPKRYSALQINDALVSQFKDIVGATLSFTGSATSGTVRTLTFGIFEDTP